MKITALYNHEGAILAAVVDDGQQNAPRPAPTEGAQVGTFEVPASASKLSLQEICSTFRIDTKAMSLAER